MKRKNRVGSLDTLSIAKNHPYPPIDFSNGKFMIGKFLEARFAKGVVDAQRIFWNKCGTSLSEWRNGMIHTHGSFFATKHHHQLNTDLNTWAHSSQYMNGHLKNLKLPLLDPEIPIEYTCSKPPTILNHSEPFSIVSNHHEPWKSSPG